MRWRVITSGAVAIAATALLAFEGERFIPYLDGGGVPTVCMGVTGPDVKMGKIYTAAECRHLNSKAVTETINAIERATLRPLPDMVGAATISLVYNIGPTAYASSTVLRRFNAGDFRGGCEAMLMWVCDNVRPGTGAKPGEQCGQAARDKAVVRGLVNRRTQERDMCLRGV